jgi:hypothetical protein
MERQKGKAKGNAGSSLRSEWKDKKARARQEQGQKLSRKVREVSEVSGGERSFAK